MSATPRSRLGWLTERLPGFWAPRWPAHAYNNNNNNSNNSIIVIIMIVMIILIVIRDPPAHASTWLHFVILR